MRFKIDENLPVEIAALLRAAGHDAMTVADQDLSGERDERIFAVCAQEERALFTLDLDFADLRVYPSRDHFGLIVLRLWQQDKNSVVTTVRRLLPVFDHESVKGKLWIVEEDRIRIRG